MKIRLASPDDLSSIMMLEAESFTGSERWSSASWDGELSAADRRVWVCVSTETPSELLGVSSFRVIDDVGELMRVLVRRSDQRRGIAGELIAIGLEWLDRQEVSSCLLEVRDDNESAIRLYRRAGFVRLDERRDYYGAGKHAVVMQRQRRKNGGANR